MADLIDDFGDASGDEPRQKFFTRVAHLCPWAVGICGPVLLATAVIPGKASAWVGAVIIIPWIIIAVTADFHVQLARICLRCMQEVPADAPIRAERRRYRIALREAHRPITLGSWRRPGYLAIAAPLFTLTFLPESVFPAAAMPWVHFLIRAFFVWTAACGWIHHRYKPWCPWCKWNDGGDPEMAPEPTPDPTGTKVA